MRKFNINVRSIGLSLITGLGLVLIAPNLAQAQAISTVTVTVNDSSSITLPTAASTSASPSSFCTGSSSTLAVSGGHLGSGTPTANWKWYEDACPTAAATAIGTGASISVSPTNTTTAPITKTYYVRAEGGFCDYTTPCVPVTVTINPTPAVTAPSNQTYCAGAATSVITLSGTPTGVVYAISGGASIGLANATGLTQIPSFTPVNTGTAPVTSTITITPSANGCTGSSVTYDITVNPTATVNAVSDITKCTGNSVSAITFGTSTTGGTVTYSWTNDNTNVGLAASGTGNISAFTAANTTCSDEVANIIVTPTITNAGSACAGTPDTFIVRVHPKPNGSIAAVNSALCQGTAVKLKYTSTCGTGPFDLSILQDNTTPNQSYTGIASGDEFTITPTPTTQGSHTYDLMKITDANGCSNPVTP